MKWLEILLRLIDQLIQSVKFKKAQNEREKLSNNPSDWFSEHFGNGMPSEKPKADKAISPSNTTD